MEVDEVDADEPCSQPRMPSLKPTISLEMWRRERTEKTLRLSKIKVTSPDEPEQILVDSNSSEILPTEKSSTLINIKGCINSFEPEVQLKGVKTAIFLLGQYKDKDEFNRNMTALLQINIIPKCVKFLMTDNMNLIRETTWLLSNMSAGNVFHTDCLVQGGIIQPIIFLLKSTDQSIVEHSVRTLGNCMGDNEEIRWKILNMRVIPPLVEVIKRFRDNIINMRTLAYTLLRASKINTTTSAKLNVQYDDLEKHYNYKPMSHDLLYASPNTRSIFQTEQILVGVQTLILLKDTDVQSSVCLILYHLTCDSTDGVDSVLRAGLLPKLLFLLNSEDNEVILSCLKAIGNIAAVKIDQLINYGIVISLVRFLKSTNSYIMYDALWILSGIADKGTEIHFKEILDSCIFEEISSLIRSENCSMHIKKECLFILKRLVRTSDEFTLRRVMDKIRSNRIMKIIVPCLKVKDPNVIHISLGLIAIILSYKGFNNNKGKNRFAKRLFQENEGLVELEGLAYNLNRSISIKACEILDKHFPDDRDCGMEEGPSSSRSSENSQCHSDNSSDELDDNQDEDCEIDGIESGRGLLL